LFQFQQFTQEFGETVNGITGVALAIDDAFIINVPATKDIDAAIDQVCVFIFGILRD